MSEVQSRPAAPRGRGSARGGRGGFAARGGRAARGHATNGDKAENAAATSIGDDSEVGQLKKKYGSKVTTIKEMFPDWTDEDIVFALEETAGDLETTVERITDGTISQWGEVSKTKKDRARSKVKETSAPSDSTNARVSRGGREGGRGGAGRGRGTERGRGRGRGGAGVAHTNGTRKEAADVSVPTEESTAWETSKSEEKATEDWGPAATKSTAAPAVQPTSTALPEGVKKTWASMFATPAPAPAPKKAPEPVEKPKEPEKPVELKEPPPAEPAPAVPQEGFPASVDTAEKPAEEPPAPQEVEGTVTPSKDELTQTNLEQVLDTSNPPPTTTTASIATASWDTRNVTPQSAQPPASGYAATALKATGSGGRSASYGRRVLDQEEAVRMPGNREVDRAAVQFGAFSLGDAGDDDVDGDREEPETRAQPPQHSPVAPRATLPPAPQQAAPVPETFATPNQTSGMPPATHPPAAPGLPSPQNVPGAQGATPQGPQANSQFGQYGRYTQPGSQEQSSLPQKPYDAFSQQTQSAQSPFEGYPNQQAQSQPQGQPGAFSSAPSDFSSYYTADPQQQRAYNSYYQQQYGLQQGTQGQDASAQQRSYSGYNGPQADNSQFPQTSQQNQSRYGAAGEGQASGHTTPNPATQSQQQLGAQGSQPQPSHQQGPQGGSYPYGHPYYSSPYYAAYMNQFQQYGGGSYGAGPYGGKGGIHAQSYQGYGMSPGGPYDHTSSPAPGFGVPSLLGRDSALSGGLGEYGRVGSAQSSTHQGLPGAHDAFSRGGSYQGQYNPPGSQSGSGEDLKPFGESKTGSGPSPSLPQAGRPGSAANTSSTSGLPPQQSSQQAGYAGYPGHLQQPGHGLHAGQAASQYGALGGAQGHQNSQYGGYQGFGGNYYGSGQQRGWGGNYGH